MEALLKHGVDVVNPSVPPITPEAIGGALYTLFYDHVRQKGAKRLPEIVPPVVYVTLAPFLGPEEAFSLATKSTGLHQAGRRRSPQRRSGRCLVSSLQKPDLAKD